nr:hypothetical protein [Tanacetum cinerariifolium]
FLALAWAFKICLGRSKPMVITKARTLNGGSRSFLLKASATTFSFRSKAYQEYYACAIGEAAPKPKASARKKKGDSASSTTTPTPTPTTTAESGPRLSAHETHISQQSGSGIGEGTGSKPGVPDVPSDDSEEELSWKSSDDEEVGSQEEGNESNDDSDDESDKDSEETVKSGAGKDGDDDDDEDDDDDDEEEETAKADEELKETGEAQIPPPTIPSIILENLPTFNSAFRFEERLRLLETSFNEYRQTNQVAGAVSAIPDIVHQYMDQQMKEAVQEAVQKQTDQHQDTLQRENDEFLRNIDENMKNVLKGLVKTQVKEQVSRILPRVEESVNATLEAEVLTRSSHSSRTSYAVAADLSKMELKKILIEKMEGNRSIQRSDEQRNLYKALVEAYEADKAILDTYGESTILKRRREDDDQEGPSAGPNRG